MKNPIKSKQSILKCLIISISAVEMITTASSIAYFSNHDEQVNKIGIGINTIEIVEEFNPPSTITAGVIFNKKVAVQCTEGVDCYVRMYCEFNSAEAENAFDIELDTTNWTAKQADGYYYYKTKISKGQYTTPLLKRMRARSGVENVSDCDVICYAESVQAMNASTGNYYSDYASAWSYWKSAKGGLG